MRVDLLEQAKLANNRAVLKDLLKHKTVADVKFGGEHLILVFEDGSSVSITNGEVLGVTFHGR